MPTCKFFDSVRETAVIPLPHSKVALGCSTWIVSVPDQIRCWPVEKCARKWSQVVLLCADLVSPNLSQGQWKWYKVVEVNDAYKYGRYNTLPPPPPPPKKKEQPQLGRQVCAKCPLLQLSQHKMAGWPALHPCVCRQLAKRTQLIT